MKKLIFLIIIVCLGYLFYINVGNPLETKDNKYSASALKNLSDNNIKETILNKEYSKVIETALLENKFNNGYLDLYYGINYIDSKNFIKNVNYLAGIRYTKDEINPILENINDNEVTKIPYTKDIVNYIILDHFKIDNINRYIAYKKENNYDYDKTVTFVNINLDYDYYSEEVVKTVTNASSETVLVNKYNRISKNFTPSLVTLAKEYSTKTLQVTNNTKIAFEKMCEDAKKEDLKIKAVSAYRTYEYQETLYNNYVKSDGKEKADTYSARAGYSEHHTGLAIDVQGSDVSYTSFDTTDEYKWVKAHAHTYGFIIRYQKEKEDVTGYMYEAWHLRYVGKDIAKEIYEKSITFDEYYVRYLEK